MQFRTDHQLQELQGALLVVSTLIKLHWQKKCEVLEGLGVLLLLLLLFFLGGGGGMVHASVDIIILVC